ncbi:MAG: O-antigen ligase family protein [Gemmatimonadaceae bacterium]
MPEQRSFAARALPFVTWGLAFHILIVAALFGALRLPPTVVRTIAAWKEMAVVLLLLTAGVRAATGRGARVRIGAVDLCVIAWLSLAVLFFLMEDVVWGGNVPLNAAAFGVRDISFFLLLYFIGRSTPEIADDPRTFRRLFIILAVTCAIAIFEWLFVTPEMLVVLGVAAYVQDFLGTAAFTVNNVYGLPDNYWSYMGGHLVRRAGSIYLSSQGFATPFLIFLPGATMWLWLRANRSVWLKVAYAVIWAGLIVSFTRTALLICILQALLILLYLRRPTGAALMVALGGLAAIVAMIVFPSLATFVMETLTWQTGSSTSHVKDWTAGITAFAEAPWGHGLGTTDQTAVRAGLDPITADNQYLKYAVEMGLPGLLIHVSTLALLGLSGYRIMNESQVPEQRAFGVMVALATLGIAIDGMTGVIFNNPIVAYLYFWFAGTAVTVAQRLPQGRAVRSERLEVVYG